MNYGTIKTCDVANGIGVRVTLFVSGCTNRCPGCFQPETWDFSYGRPFDDGARQQLFDQLAQPYINGLTLLGGEPFEPENQRALEPFLQEVRRRYPTKTVWSYTGFTLEQLLRAAGHPRCECTDGMLSLLDVLVDGRFEEAQKDIALRFRGSRNQRILDVPASLREGRAVLWEENRP